MAGLLVATFAASFAAFCTPAFAATSSTVYLPSADGRTELVAYVFRPAGPGPFPAMVMLHGRAGPYSSNVNAGCTQVGRGTTSPCNADTQSRRATLWGAFWAERGVLAIHVDSFGPRGVGHGFGRNTHGDAERDAVNELTVRPLDAEGALAYLRSRPDVLADRIAVQGWSNGASTTLNTLFRQPNEAGPMRGFRAALAFYPGCGPRALLSQRYRSGAPTLVFLASADEEVDPERCRRVLTDAPAGTADRVQLVWLDDATHDFDDPGKARQSVPANAAAQARAMRDAVEFIGKAFAR